MSKKQKLALVAIGLVAVAIIVGRFLSHTNIAILSPAGEVGQKERNLMLLTFGLCLIVVIPVFVMTIYIAWKYREGNKSAKYQPNWDHSPKIELVWWAVPIMIISVLALVTWRASHDLDPTKTLASVNKPINVQVVALPWKWLFIYPDQKVAAVNYLQFPVNTPVNFQITSDAPMNSFWIPQLGGQIYAMSGMSTQLHLIAAKPGNYDGRSANISGRGFAGMNFTAHASDNDEFSSWVKAAKRSSNKLTISSYNKLAQDSENNPVTYYSLNANNLYTDVIMKYMESGSPMADQTGNSAQMEHNFYH